MSFVTHSKWNLHSRSHELLIALSCFMSSSTSPSLSSTAPARSSSASTLAS